MAPPFRSAMALCAPAALAAFVAHPGMMFRTHPTTRAETGRSWIRKNTAFSHSSSSNHVGKSSSFTSVVRKRRGRSWTAGPLFAKPLSYEVTHRPGVNSSVIFTLDVPGETTKLCYDKAVREFSKRAGNGIPGFSAGDKHPPQIIERHFGVGEVRSEALKIISDTVVNEAINKFDFRAIGSATLVQDVGTVLNMYTPGEPIMLEIKAREMLMVATVSLPKSLRRW